MKCFNPCEALLRRGFLYFFDLFANNNSENIQIRGFFVKIRVFEIITDTNIGGAGKVLLTRLRALDKEKFEESVVVPQGSELLDELRELECDIYEMGGCADRSLDPFEIVPLVSFFKENKPDIVNCHGCLSARIAAYLARVPVRIYTRHCAFEPSFLMTHFPMKNINGMLNKMLNTKIISVAYAASENLYEMGVDEGQVEVIINGVAPIKKYSSDEKKATRERLGIPLDAFVCGICARLEDCKGIDVFLRAARRLISNGGNYYFLILGKGSLEEELRGLARSLGISERVRFCGFLQDITPYINCFDLNINCSRGTETSSLALSEGMSIGLVSVVSDFGGNPYMIKDGYNGLIYKTDDFCALADKIEILMKDRELYKKMSDNALERYKNELNAENMARKTEKLYRTLFLATKSKYDSRRDSEIYHK